MKGWSRRFDTPIEADGCELKTLRDAGDYVLKLPKAKARPPHWQLAAQPNTIMMMKIPQNRIPIGMTRFSIWLRDEFEPAGRRDFSVSPLYGL